MPPPRWSETAAAFKASRRHQRPFLRRGLPRLFFWTALSFGRLCAEPVLSRRMQHGVRFAPQRPVDRRDGAPQRAQDADAQKPLYILLRKRPVAVFGYRGTHQPRRS